LDKRNRFFLLSGIFLISFGVIAFEISLTRLLSTVLTYHYVFAIASLALLGQGMGALAVYYLRKENSFNLAYISGLSLYGAAGAVGMILSAVFIVVSAGGGAYSNLYLIAHWLTVMLTFACGGAILAEIFRLMPELSGRLYGADLVGAAIGCVGVVQVLNLFGAAAAVLVFAAVVSLGGLSIYLAGHFKKNYRKGLLVVVAFLGAVVLAVVGGSGFFLADIPVGANQEKEIYDSIYYFDGEIIETRWSAFGKTDLVRYQNIPHHMDIYLDGTAGSPMYEFSGEIDRPGAGVETLLAEFPGYLPFLFLKEGEKENALIIGPGGGRDILLALAGEVNKIIAVEVNPDLVDIVEEYAWYNGGLYSGFEEVEWVTGEGRSYILGRQNQYDLIMMSLPVTNTGRSREGLALTESFLFTTEAIDNYLDHLTDWGSLLVIAHNDAEILRLLSISLAVFGERGIAVEQAMEHLYIIGADPYPVFVLRQYPFESYEIDLIYEEAIFRRGYNPMVSYFPHISEFGAANSMLMSLGMGIISPDEMINMVSNVGFDISLVSDDNPFFYNLTVGMPQPVSLVFWASLVFTLAAFFFPGLKKQNRLTATERDWDRKKITSSSLMFLFMGMGFMLVEISLIQRFILFLGQPVFSLALLLFAILLGTGSGSLVSSRISGEKLSRGRAIAATSVVMLLLVYSVVLPLLFMSLLGENLAVRGVVTFFLLVPLGFLMGFPFPISIREMNKEGMESLIPWMWGLNGFSSVFGSVLAIVLAIQFGFTVALYSGILCYLAIVILSKVIDGL
jgi:hypothetical protein